MKSIFSRYRPLAGGLLLAWWVWASPLSLPAVSLTDFGYEKMKTGSSRPMLVILAEFPSPPFAHGPDITYFSNRVFQAGSEWTVNAYFKEVSNNRFQWTPAAVLHVNMPESGRHRNLGGDDSRYASNIIYCAVATNGFNWDGYAPGKSSISAQELAISLFSNDGGKSARGVSNVRPPGCTKPYSGRVYVGQPQDLVDVDCHEMSHILGAIDFYGIWGVSDSLHDRLSLMGPNHGEKCHLDPWHKLQFGWTQPRIHSLNSSGTTSLQAAQVDDGYLGPIILYDPNRGTDEFFMLEYRTRTVTDYGPGYDQHVAGNGMVIWHVLHDANKHPRIMAEIAWPDAERPWHECMKCRALTLKTSPLGTCPAGGRHDPFQDLHGMIKNDPSVSGETDWKRCTKCQSLFYGPRVTSSVCPAGGQHNPGSGTYTLFTDPGVLANPHWHRCTRCETLVRKWETSYSPWTTNSVCPAGGRHTPDTNTQYRVPSFWAIRTILAEAHPDLRRGHNKVWPGGSRTPWLHWYDRTPACVSVEVSPFDTGNRYLQISWTSEPGVWVDFSYTGIKNGSFWQPFNQLNEGVNAVAPGGYLYIKHSATPLPANVTKSMYIRTYNGPVRIGKNF